MAMTKHKKVGDEKDEVGKRGSPPSSTKNERAQKGKKGGHSLPKVGKREVGDPKGRPLH
jgi:hypothetical protein